MELADRATPQMLCSSCCRAAAPDTWIPGSDRLELAAWCCLGVPGLLYCAWRHLLRAKICRFCGGQELIREARASKRPARVERWVSRLHSAGTRTWPKPLDAPRVRLRHGAPLAATGALAGILALLALVQNPAAVAPALALWVACALFAQLAWTHELPPPCRAWDEGGRALHVEVVPY